ncbi:MAG: quinol monooxygenase YgiN [Pseudohongiellaceae bacterium]|jgi:quinol monooxygenase YgiN
MSSQDSCVSIVPYFKVHEGKLKAFKGLCEQFVSQTSEEAGCLYYGFCFNGDEAHCREGYEGAENVLAHLENVGQLLAEALEISDLTKLEIHGNKDELGKLYDPLEEMNPDYFILEYGFRR